MPGGKQDAQYHPAHRVLGYRDCFPSIWTCPGQCTHDAQCFHHQRGVSSVDPRPGTRPAYRTEVTVLRLDALAFVCAGRGAVLDNRPVSQSATNDDGCPDADRGARKHLIYRLADDRGFVWKGRDVDGHTHRHARHIPGAEHAGRYHRMHLFAWHAFSTRRVDKGYHLTAAHRSSI